MELDECLRQWKAKGFKVGGSMCDLLSRSQRQKFMDNVSSYFDGKINILVSLTMQSFSLIKKWNLLAWLICIRVRIGL